MIDTDKYEGHTEGPWKAFEDIEGADTNTPYRTGAWMVGNAVSKSSTPPLHFDDEHDPHIYNVMGICSFSPNRQNNESDAQLIADAPLLLAEVKRLQRDNAMLENDLEHTKHRFRRSLERCIETKESLLAEIKRLSLTVEDTGVMRSE